MKLLKIEFRDHPEIEVEADSFEISYSKFDHFVQVTAKDKDKNVVLVDYFRMSNIDRIKIINK